MRRVRRYGYRRDSDQPLTDSLADIGAGQGLSAADRRILDWHYFWDIELDRSFALSQISSWQFDTGQSYRGPDLLFRDGYDQILPGLAAGLDIRLDHVVSAIDYSGDTIVVQTNDGPFQAERCLVTLPLGVLKGGSVAFTPALPTKTTAAIDKLGFGAGYKMVLQFPQVFWDQAVHFFGYAAAIRGESAEFLNMARYTGHPVLLMNTMQDYAATLESMTKTDATARVMSDLRNMFGPSIPDPVAVLTTDWGVSPYTGGTYTYWTVGSSHRDQKQLTRPIDRKLFLAGEHTMDRFPGTVHGAYLSGLKAARTLRRHAR